MSWRCDGNQPTAFGSSGCKKVVQGNSFAALFSRVLLFGKLVEFDVVQAAADLLDFANINRLDYIARLGVDRDRPARARQLQPFDRRDQLIAIGRAARLL